MFSPHFPDEETEAKETYLTHTQLVEEMVSDLGSLTPEFMLVKSPHGPALVIIVITEVNLQCSTKK